MTTDFLDALRKEQEAFDAKLPELLHDHKGEFVVIKDGELVALFPSYEDAYADALGRFGHDAVFLISEVIERSPVPVSISWNAGVLFGGS